MHFEVHYLLSWFKTLYIHKIGFKPKFQISHRQLRDDVEALEEELLDLGNVFKFWNLLSINCIESLMYSSKI